MIRRGDCLRGAVSHEAVLKYSVPLIVAIIELVLQTMTLAADPRFPDWPCNQIKVPEISAAAVWSGPSIDGVGSAWEQDAVTRDLVARLAARRTSLEEAQKLISDFITGSAAERQQKAFAEKTRSEIAKLRELQDASDRDQSRIEELANQVTWDTRIFEERRKTIGYACEVPVLIEQRLFALARMIEQSIE